VLFASEVTAKYCEILRSVYNPDSDCISPHPDEVARRGASDTYVNLAGILFQIWHHLHDVTRNEQGTELFKYQQALLEASLM
jgi:hypothetical protein